MFNKFDIKIHSNMYKSLQEARLQLSDPTSLECTITKKKLAAIQTKRQREISLLIDIVFGEESTIKLVKKYLASKNKNKNKV